MRVRSLLTLLKWPAVLLAAGGLLAAAYLLNDRIRQQQAAEAAAQVPPARRAANNIVKLGARLAESHGIKDEPAQAVTWYPRLTVYGRVVPNPQATAEIRSPFAGTLRADPDTPWPAPGRGVKAGQVLGRVDVRIGPQERLDLQSKLSEARLRYVGTEDILRVQQERVNRLKPSPRSEFVPQGELDEAMVKLTEARTQLA